ncbi:MAG: MotA/TolQ/ExbB proton channel family protein [Thermotogae bacterium]|nr:MotA/TolQ/ExbB proton channel family protein [Thermotogota bacterium]
MVETLRDLFVRGGIMMWPILFVALIALAISIERFYSLFWKIRVNPVKLVEDVIKIIEEKGVNEAIDFLAKKKNPVAKVLMAGLEKAGKSKVVVEEAMTRRALRELAFLDRGMIYIAAAVTLAPILGFLGTVSGMINAFDAIAKAGEVEPTVVAAGISEALITTAFGLSVAAPFSLLYAIFMDRINSYQRQIEEAANFLLEYLAEAGIVREA